MPKELLIFDNSALSRLFEEPERDRLALLTGLRILGMPWISALNVYETARTPGVALRHAKLRFYAEVSGDIPPIADPMALLAAAARTWRFGEEPPEPCDRIAHQILMTPQAATDEFGAAMTAWMKNQEREFGEMTLQIREAFLAAYGTGDVRFRTEAELMLFFFAMPDTAIHGMIAPIFAHWTGTDLAPAETPALLRMPIWRVFMAGQIHALWLRAADRSIASPKRTGIFDTDSAAYLPFCDRFITQDRAQLATFTAANAFNNRGTKVEAYDELRDRLLV